MSVQRAWHLVTGEYPPQPGGVSDYSCALAKGLAAEGDDVHVWCPSAPYRVTDIPGVTVHGDLGRARTHDLRNLTVELDRFPGPRQILVQWVPHAFGCRSMNLGFCRWLWRRATRYGDQVDLMVHEPFLSFGEGSWRQDAAATVHRVMTIVLLRAASRVWISIPRWERLLRPYTFGRNVPFEWLPIPSNIPVVEDTAGVKAIRQQYAADKCPIIGHFGTYGQAVTPALDPILLAWAGTGARGQILLMGMGSDE
jgi:hypothetical protein